MLIRNPLLIPVAALLLARSFVVAASIECADGLRFDGAVTFAVDGKIVLEGLANPEPRSFTWEQVRAVRLSKSTAELKPLPAGWRVEDVGRVVGDSSNDNGIFTLSVSGGEMKEKKYQPLHYAYRVVRGEPEVVAQIKEMRGPAPAVGGVMLRENLEASSGFAMLGVTGDKHLRYEWREGSWNSVNARDLGVVQLPIWLKIVRLEKEGGLEAFRSSDGVNWTSAARGKLNCKNAPYPENSDHWVIHVYSGLAITAPPPGAEAGMQCDHATISIRGFLGEYFADQTFTKRVFTRPEKKIEYWWSDRSPAPMLEPENFSVRWRGEVTPKFSEPYRFHCDPGDRLLIDGTEVTCGRWDQGRKDSDLAREVPLTAGRKYQVQFEFAKTGREAKSARLGWSSRGQQREYITSAVTSYQFTTNTPGDDAETATNFFLPAGVWLGSGSFLAGEITSSDRSATQVKFAGKTLTVLNHRIARLILRPSRKPIRFEIAAGRTGVFLQNGDFLESEIDELNDRTLVMNSVLFGRRSYSRENASPFAVVMNDLNRSNSPLLITLLDGTKLTARSLRTDGNALVVQEPALGEIRVALDQLREVRNTALAAR